MNQKIGLIQSRGLGDIVIALPIAGYYRDQGYSVVWPICSEFLSHWQHTVPWVEWIPVTTDSGSFFFEQPIRALRAVNCTEAIVLYQALTGQEFHRRTFFQHTKFDQYKYTAAEVPFHYKWRLPEYITRNVAREQALYDQIIGTDTAPYVIIHTEGSDHHADFDRTIIPTNWRQIEITAATDSVWDWLTILERAECIILVDSVFSNIVDQMNIGTADSRYFIPRSHIGLTPVLGQHWNWIANTRLDKSAETIRTG